MQKSKKPKPSQVCNAQHRLRKGGKAGGQFENLNSLALDHPDIRFLMTQPSVVVVVINPRIIEQAREILRITFETAEHKQTSDIYIQASWGTGRCCPSNGTSSIRPTARTCSTAWARRRTTSRLSTCTRHRDACRDTKELWRDSWIGCRSRNNLCNKRMMILKWSSTRMKFPSMRTRRRFLDLSRNLSCLPSLWFHSLKVQ